MKHIFISYRSTDQEAALLLKAVFEANGMKTWISCSDIQAGGDFPEEIMQAIGKCSALVLLLTAEAQASKWVKNEITCAIDCNKPIFPVQLEEVPLNPSFKYLLSTAQITTLPHLGLNDPETMQFVNTVKNNPAQNEKKHTSPKKQPQKKARAKWIVIPFIAVFLMMLIAGGVILKISSTMAQLFDNNLNTFLSDFSANSSDPIVSTPDNTSAGADENTSDNTTGNTSDRTDDYIADNTELPPEATTDTNQIPECHADIVLDVKYASALEQLARTIYVTVGDYASIPGRWSDSVIYSEDTRIAVPEGGLIKGIAPGTTYVVEASTTTAAVTAYRVIVTEP